MLLVKKLFNRVVIISVFLLVSAFANAQSFSKIDQWLQENAEGLGGRAILTIYKDGKLVYTKSVNQMTSRQKMGARMIARRTGKEVNTDDFTTSSRQPIASCSKWMSAALVMTFVDEKKLNINDTVGKWLPVLSQHGKGSITI